jgi:hypothetical protein
MRGSPLRARAKDELDLAVEDSDAPDSAPELVDVPAAVVCANCRDPECPGCLFDEPTHASGIVAVVPWERPGLGAASRLWNTARVATTSAESFFGALPDGDAVPALRFGLLAEVVAISGLVLALLPGVLLFAPSFVSIVLADEALRVALMRALAFGVPGLAFAMVAVHAAHGLGLDLGARRAGSTSRGRGLRFGLYACGWELITLPLGIAYIAARDGLRAGVRAVPLSITVPGRAARAYLRGIHRLDDEQARAAARVGTFIALMLVLIGALSVIAGTALARGI